jgi:hypothetical protein
MAQRRAPGGPGPAGRPGPGRGAARSGPTVRTTREPMRCRRHRSVLMPPSAAHRPAAEPARSATRPASARRAAASGSAKRTAAPQPGRLTGRATILGLVLVGLLLAYAYRSGSTFPSKPRSPAGAGTGGPPGAHRGPERKAGQVGRPEHVKAQARKRFQLVDRATDVHRDLRPSGPRGPRVPPRCRPRRRPCRQAVVEHRRGKRAARAAMTS